MIGRRMSWLKVHEPAARIVPQTSTASMIQRRIVSALAEGGVVIMALL